MDDFLQKALELVKAQAGTRVMTPDEILSMVRQLNGGLKALSEGGTTTAGEFVAEPQRDPRKSIKEKSVTCLECGKVFKIITNRHLVLHDLDADSYREKWNLKKGTPLVCKSLQRERRNKMKEMKLWEKRGSVLKVPKEPKEVKVRKRRAVATK